MTARPLTTTRRRRVPPSMRANIHVLATAAVFARYPFLLPIAAPRSTIKADGDGWIVTVWLHRHLYRRVRVDRDGQARLLPADQQL